MSYLDPETRLSRHFRLAEFTHSDTADAHGIDIRVLAQSPVHRQLATLVERVLEPLRRHLGEPVRVNSGYRPVHVNELVGGASSSQHIRGQAADVVVASLTPLEVAETIAALELPVDQCIHEFGRWVHVSYGTRQRREYLTAYTDAEGATNYAPGLHRIEEIES